MAKESTMPQFSGWLYQVTTSNTRTVQWTLRGFTGQG